MSHATVTTHRPPAKPKNTRSGFTLIELSIVLVIIGLIVGGVLVGQDLIKAAQIRATLNQLEQYTLAVNTFKLKYGNLPGDLPAAKAAQFGFVTRNGGYTRGDGNGVIQCAFGAADGVAVASAEHAMFWRDLSEAKLIKETFNTAIDWYGAASSDLNVLLPQAKLGRGNHIYVWSGGIGNPGTDGQNYFGISTLALNSPYVYGNAGMQVIEAANIDQKVDDGLPQTGNVIVGYPFHGLSVWGSGNPNGYGGGAAPGVAVSASSITCYDNANNASAPMVYSTASFPNNINCALSFRTKW